MRSQLHAFKVMTTFPSKTYSGLNLTLICGIIWLNSTPLDYKLSEVRDIYFVYYSIIYPLVSNL